MAEQQVRSGDNVDLDLDDETASTVAAFRELPFNVYAGERLTYAELKEQLEEMREQVWSSELRHLNYACAGARDTRRCVDLALSAERAFWVCRETGQKQECAGHLRELCVVRQEVNRLRQNLCITSRALNGAQEQLAGVLRSLEVRAQHGLELARQLAEAQAALASLKAATGATSRK